MKPTICMVSHSHCIRVEKEAWEFKKRGYKVKVVSNRAPLINRPGLHDIYDTIGLYRLWFDKGKDGEPDVLCKEMFYQTLKETKADIFICHNEPTWVVTDCKSVVKEPVIFDVHDTLCTRTGDTYPMEQEAFDACDAVVHVSDDIAAHLNAAYKVSKPSAVVRSLPPSDWFVVIEGNKYVNNGRIIYQGGALSPIQIEKAVARGSDVALKFDYRDFTEVIKKLVFGGRGVDMLIPRGEAHQYYGMLGAQCGWIDNLWELYLTIREHEWGLALFPEGSDHIKYAMPNKVFDYMAAGIPCIANKDTSFGKLVEKYELGFTMGYGDDFEFPDWKKYKKKVLHNRKLLCMDKEIDKYIELVEGL